MPAVPQTELPSQVGDESRQSWVMILESCRDRGELSRKLTRECSQDCRKEKEEQEELAKKEKILQVGQWKGQHSKLMCVNSLAHSVAVVLTCYQPFKCLHGFISMSDIL